MLPKKMYGFLLPQRDRVLSEIYPMIGSMIASISRGSAASNPANNGFIFSARTSMTINIPKAAGNNWFAREPDPNASFVRKGQHLQELF